MEGSVVRVDCCVEAKGGLEDDASQQLKIWQYFKPCWLC